MSGEGEGGREASRPKGGQVDPAHRERVVDALCAAFADDRMEVEEFERRVEAAHRARSGEELRGLLVDLPGDTEVLARRDEADRATPEATSGGGLPDRSRRDWTLPPMASPGEVAEHSFVVGFMGGGGRKGRWIPSRRVWCVGVMGGAELDMRDAIFPPGVTEVRVFAFWGGVEVTVPPGVRVEVSGVGVMGAFEHDQTVAPTDNPDAPIVRVTGLALMGGAEVTVRFPGESARDARRRVREERKARRRLLRGR